MWKDYLKLHFIVFLWGFTSILGKEISLGSVETVIFRTLIAAFLVWVLLKYKKIILQAPKQEVYKILGIGSLIALHWITFFASIKVSNVSIAMAGIATGSFWTALVEPFLMKSKVKKYELFLGVLVIIGLYVIFKFEFNHFLGLSLSLISAFFAALFSVLNGKFTHKHNEYEITFWEMCGAFISCIAFLPIYGMYFVGTEGINLSLTLRDFYLFLILSGACTVYAFAGSVELMKRLSVFDINLSVNLEPIYAIIIAIILYPEEEKMNSGFYLGTLIILASVVLYPVFKRIEKRKAKKLAEKTLNVSV